VLVLCCVGQASGILFNVEQFVVINHAGFATSTLTLVW
jgi:hypothetical protein